ncbi:GntR family transcriptional regulator [Amycolatopsis sp. NBC_00355]|uniref:GntR family transcriptional regulator n=1 Tax=Amycolatopsis sp. NBC_00355 TaxID=2975957 RepID=UPI002E272411
MNIDEIARKLGVSGTPVREALARLESEELVSRLPLRGYRVTELLNRTEVDDMYALRLLLEPPSAALAAASMSDSRVSALEAELATCPAVPVDDAYSDYKALTAHDARLHELILRLAGNVAVEQAFRPHPLPPALLPAELQPAVRRTDVRGAPHDRRRLGRGQRVRRPQSDDSPPGSSPGPPGFPPLRAVSTLQPRVMTPRSRVPTLPSRAKAAPVARCGLPRRQTWVT